MGLFWPQGLSRSFEEERNILVRSGFEPCLFSLLACISSLCQCEVELGGIRKEEFKIQRGEQDTGGRGRRSVGPDAVTPVPEAAVLKCAPFV
jgi:hypothetical protein